MKTIFRLYKKYSKRYNKNNTRNNLFYYDFNKKNILKYVKILLNENQIFVLKLQKIDFFFNFNE